MDNDIPRKGTQLELYDGSGPPFPLDAELLTIGEAVTIICERLRISESTFYAHDYNLDMTRYVHALSRNPKTGKKATFRIARRDVERVLWSILSHPVGCYE